MPTVTTKFSNYQKLTFSLLAMSMLVLLASLDPVLFYGINHVGNLILPAFISAHLSNLGDGVIVAGMSLVLLQFRPKLTYQFLFAALLLIIITQFLKYLLAIPRPPAVLAAESMTVIGSAFGKNSFPSGHAASIFVLAGFLVLNIKARSYTSVIILLASVVALSRIVVGVHWFSDVAFGSFLGLCVAFISNKVITVKPALGQCRLVIIPIAAIIAYYAVDKGSEFPYGVIYSNYIVLIACFLIVTKQLKALVQSNLHKLNAVACYYTKHRKHVTVRFLGFGVVGIIGFIVDTTCYLLGLHFGLQHTVARALSYWVAASNNWYLNRIFTYNDAQYESAQRQWMLYLLMCVLSFFVNWGTYTLLTTKIDFFMTHKFFAFMAGIIAGITINFTGAHNIIFKLKKA